MQGGIEYLTNINIGPSEDFSLNVISDWELGFIVRRVEEGFIGMKVYETIYEFGLRPKKRSSGFMISGEELIHRCEFVFLDRKLKERRKLGKGRIAIRCSNGRLEVDLDKPDEIPINGDEILYLPLRKRLPSDVLLLEASHFLALPLRNLFRDISIYDIDPKLPKRATPITGKAELEEDGSNLSIILRNIMSNRDKRRRLFNLVRELLPFIADLGVEKFADKTLLFKLKEVYSGDQFLPASLISDGTINIIALIIALYFEEKPLIIIEEPERNIHPHLISKVVDMMKDASRGKQIIVTTHNPEIVKYAGIEDLLLVTRDKEGFSNISKPADKEEIRIFLKNEIGVEELFVQNLLGI